MSEDRPQITETGVTFPRRRTTSKAKGEQEEPVQPADRHESSGVTKDAATEQVSDSKSNQPDDLKQLKPGEALLTSHSGTAPSLATEDGWIAAGQTRRGTTTALRAVGRKRRRPLRWALPAIALVLIGWMLVDRLVEPDGGPLDTSSGTATGGSSSAAQQTALDYETAMLAGESEKACGYEVDPDYCLRILGSAHQPLATSEAPKVLETAEVSRPSGVGDEPETATAVLVQFTVKDQAAPQREAVFVRVSDDKVIGTESVSSSDAGRSLQQLFEDDAS